MAIMDESKIQMFVELSDDDEIDEKDTSAKIYLEQWFYRKSKGEK